MVAALLAMLATSARAQGPPPTGQPASAQERQRAELLRELGLKKNVPGAAPAPAPSPADAPAAKGTPATASPPSPAIGGESPPGGAAATGPSFRKVIHPLLIQTCTPCHATGGPGAATRFKLSRDAAADHETAFRLVNVRDPAASPLLAKPSGAIHAGGAPWPPTSAAYGRVLAWIQRGARLDGAGTGAPEPLPLPTATPTPTLDAKTPTPKPVAAPVAALATAGVEAPGIDFTAAVHPLLMTACAGCHGPKGPAAMSRLVLSGDAARDEPLVERQIDRAAPTLSPLLTKAEGLMHGGGVVIPAADARHDVLRAWINDVVTRAPPAAPTQLAQGVSPPTPASPLAPVAASPTATLAGALPPLPYGFMLNGRFDVVYEHRQFSGNPFGGEGVDALRSYHHFLFLTRESTDDPFGLSLELLSLQFWEVHARLGGLPRGGAWQVVLSAGKLLVPFGAEPLLHQSYGGLSGFDQRILPVVWAQEGAAAHLVVQKGRLALTDDLYVVRGYRLRDADSVLNLQGDLSPIDDAHLGWGNRVGVGWRNFSAWYSAYFNPLGFGRRLFMQAVDVMLWRPRSVPVLGHFSAGAGFLRADVSGGEATGVGGPGKDDYQFGSYFQLRYHPTEWLYLQYRQGLRTVDNRRGLIVDDTRLTALDGSTHNFGVVARVRGVSLGVYYFINLEKVDEIPDDLFRVSLTYDF